MKCIKKKIILLFFITLKSADGSENNTVSLYSRGVNKIERKEIIAQIKQKIDKENNKKQLLLQQKKLLEEQEINLKKQLNQMQNDKDIVIFRKPSGEDTLVNLPHCTFQRSDVESLSSFQSFDENAEQQKTFFCRVKKLLLVIFCCCCEGKA